MNKISKKIVALVTMAAFVLTLVPFAAFAATTSSSVKVAEDSQEITLSEGEATAAVEVTVAEADSDSGANSVYVWLVDENNDYYRYATVVPYSTGAEGESTDGVVGQTSGNFIGAAKIATANATTYKVVFKLTEAGTYTVKAGVDLSGDTAKTIGELATINAVSGQNTIAVSDAETYVDSLTLESTKVDGTNDTVAYTRTPDGGNVGVDGVQVKVHNKYVEDKSDVTPGIEGQEVTIEANKALKVIKPDDTSKTAITSLETDANGQIEFDVIAAAGTPAGLYPIKLTCGDKSFTIKVKYEDTISNPAASVEVVDTGKTVVDTEGTNLGDVAQVVFKDENGKVVSGSASVYTASQPEKSNVTFDLGSQNSDGTYSLTKSAGDLKVGKYTVGVTLAGKNTAEVSFTVAEFGEVKDVKVVFTDDNASDAEVTEVVPEGTYTGTVTLVDENGLEVPANGTHSVNDLVAALTSGKDAIDGSLTTTNLGTDGTFTFKVAANDKDDPIIGTKIAFYVFSQSENISVDADVVVADPNKEENLVVAFDSDNGEVKKNNNVTVSLETEDGKVPANVNGAKVYYELVSNSNEDATVILSKDNDTLNSDGEATLALYADQETVAEIRVIAILDDVVYGNTLKYTFGEQDIPVDTSVVMTIGSSDFVVNNNIVSVEDAAPYVANDRTYVPFRALGEALGAEVVWDNDARTVTYTLGQTEIVMTIGEKTYTVNGEEKTMDVAPEITNDRTYVPVRFVGEALGFKVTALSAADGTTASVLFQK